MKTNLSRIQTIAGLLILTLAGGASAQSSTTTLNYAFYGPADRYLIELFEVGHPYPSRQDWDLSGGYNGRATYRRNWDYISKGRDYFIRVTNLRTGQRKQMRSFHIAASWGNYYNSPDFNWYAQ